jgi:hypothetical protein
MRTTLSAATSAATWHGGAVSPNGTLVALSSLDGFAPRQVHREVAGCAPANASRLKVISLTWSEAAPEDSTRRLLR